jgi:hypothetical protein
MSLRRQTISNYRSRLRKLRRAFAAISNDETEKKAYLGERILALERKLVTAPPPEKPGRRPGPITQEEIDLLASREKVSGAELERLAREIEEEDQKRTDWSPEAVVERRKKVLEKTE